MSDVAVVIPCYNLGAFLPEAVDSVRAQTRRPDELVIIDDGSTDKETIACLEAIANQGISVISTPNRGACAARNTGIEATRSEYILCLDADDVLSPDYLERTTALLDSRHECGIATTHVEFFGERSGIWRPSEYSPTTLLWRNCIASASLFRRRCWKQVGGYHDLPAMQDWNFWLSIVEHGWQWDVVPEVLYRYRIRKGSVSETGRRERADLVRTLVTLHQASYRKSVSDVVVEMDTEITRLRHKVARLEQERRALGLPSHPLSEGDDGIELDPAELQSAFEEFGRALRDATPAGARIAVPSGIPCELPNCDERFILPLEGRPGAGVHPEDWHAEAAEQARRSGAEFLAYMAPAAPGLSRWAASPGIVARLRQTFEVVAREEVTLIDLRKRHEYEHHTFSVVICTYNRAAFIRQAIESVFAQEYPRDSFELIVIDNGSTDDTTRIVEECASRSPIAFSFHIEARNGLSHARNLGVEKSRLEYVAFLDDDATACTDWLAQFNAVINSHHALVVGGRVEKVFEEGFTPPAWYRFPYLQGFFGINYRERGRNDRIIRIRKPLYIGGGNSAYARRLFAYFGGYDPRLGRDGRTLLAGEETFLNGQLERNDIPIYYTDDAVIFHFIERYRVTRQHIRRKAMWSGITNAILSVMMHGREETRVRSRSNVKELRRLVWQLIRQPRDLESFSRLCRAIYNVAFLLRFLTMALPSRRPRYKPCPIEFDPQTWIDDLLNMPEGREKYRQLHNLFLAFGDRDSARWAHARLSPHLTRHELARRPIEPNRPETETTQVAYRRLLRHTRRIAAESLPKGARVLVVSRGDRELLELGNVRCQHFPQDENGEYAGYYPENGAAAVDHLEKLRARGGEFILFPETSMWWLDHYPEFRDHLERHYRLALDSRPTCRIYDLRLRRAGESSGDSTLKNIAAAAASIMLWLPGIIGLLSDAA